MNEERIRELRTWRTTATAIAIIGAGLLIAHAFTASWHGTLILGAITLLWTVVAVRATWKIHAARAVQARLASRVDWTMIRVMEHEVYGRIFQHDGAPGLSGVPVRPYPRPGRACPCGGARYNHPASPHYRVSHRP